MSDINKIKVGKGWREIIKEKPELVNATPITLQELEAELKEFFEQELQEGNGPYPPFGFYEGGLYHLGGGAWGGKGALKQVNEMIRLEASRFLQENKE